MTFEDVIAFVEKQIGHDLGLEEINYLSIAYQAGRNAQAKRDAEIAGERRNP